MYKKRKKFAVSEIIGAVLLLTIVTSVMTVVFFQLSSDKGPIKQAFVKLVGKIEKTNLIVEHNGGESLGLDTNLSFAYSGKNYTYTVGEILIDDNHNGLWNLGEKIIFPFTYDLNNLSKDTSIDMMAVDIESNSIQFLGSFEPHPIVDLELVTMVSDSNPKRYDYINVTILLYCLGGDINGSADIYVKFLIPDGLKYMSNSCTSDLGTYNNSTGIWYIEKIIGSEPIALNIQLQVTSKGFREFIQFAMILDGSNSITSSDWTLMCNGLSQALANESVFPHDESVELTVIQFGKEMGYNYWGAVVEIPPTIINNDIGTPGYFQTNANIVNNLIQSKGNTPMGCGIRLAADQLYNSQNFSYNRKQISLMITDGEPNCDWKTDTYKGQRNDAAGKTTTEEALTYLISKLNMDPEEDEFDVFAVGSGPDIAWLNQSIVWPKPGHIAPPFINGRGWVSKVNTWQDFSERIKHIFQIFFGSILFKTEIVSAFTIDPNKFNNINQGIITPST